MSGRDWRGGSKVVAATPVIEPVVDQLINKCGGIYSDDVCRQTGLPRETVGRWLKLKGFRKTGNGNSKHWKNEEWLERETVAAKTKAEIACVVIS